MLKGIEPNIVSLALEIDALSRDVDPHEYDDQVSDRFANVVGIFEDLRNGRAEAYADWLDELEKDALDAIDAHMFERARTVREELSALSES